MDDRDYRIRTDDCSYWITESERNKYLSERGDEGIGHVALREGLLILPINFQDIVHVSVIQESQEINQALKVTTARKFEYAD